MDLSVSLLGLKFSNPLGPASGSLTGTLENLYFFNDSKVGAIVAKTISVEGAVVPKPCIAMNGKTVLNCELWSEDHSDRWFNEILPEIHNKKKKPLIISVGYKEEDFRYLIPRLHQYADIFEISTHYTKSGLTGIVRSIRENTDKPVLMKLSPHIEDYLAFVDRVLEAGATGIVATNSLGPATAVDLKKRKILLGNEKGEVWISGPPIKPIALNRVYRIRTAYPDIPIVGVGGIENAKDVLEFVLAGADLVQMLSSALVKGRELYNKIIDDLPKALKEHDFESIEEIRKIRKETILRVLKEDQGGGGFPWFGDACNLCDLCAMVCPATAISKGISAMIVDREKCERCGLCESRCPKEGAIGGVFS